MSHIFRTRSKRTALRSKTSDSETIWGSQQEDGRPKGFPGRAEVKVIESGGVTA